jgi:hypothetical protein
MVTYLLTCLGLEELQLFGNRLSGAIPHTLSNLTRLKLLSLGEYTGGNDFAPASLPTCLAALVSLEALFCANCNLTGPIPSWIGNLTGAHVLQCCVKNFVPSVDIQSLACMYYCRSAMHHNIKFIEKNFQFLKSLMPGTVH